jgi:DNA-binding NarL/FixJ family response regulator
MDILLAHAHAVTRALLRAELQEKGFHIVGEASNGKEAVELAIHLHPDVVVLQMAMPSLDGIDVAQQINRHLPLTTFVLLNSMELDAWAPGEISLTAMRRRQPNGSETYWHQEARERFRSLTTRQRQILTLILMGASNKVIAMDLGISQRTVENHRAQIMRKTGSKSLPELARTAFAINWSGPARAVGRESSRRPEIGSLIDARA